MFSTCDQIIAFKYQLSGEAGLPEQTSENNFMLVHLVWGINCPVDMSCVWQSFASLHTFSHNA